MSTKLRRILTDVFPVETFKNFTKRVFWMKQPDTERYPEHWQLELHGDEWKRIDQFKVGTWLEAEVEIRGRKWRNSQNRESIIMSLKCVGLAQYVPPTTTRTYKPGGAQQSKPTESDDLPF